MPRGPLTPGPAASALLNDPGFIGDSGTNNTDEANSFDNCQDASHLLQFGPAGPLDDANGDGYPDWLVLGLKPSAVNDGSPPSIYDLLLADGYGFDSNGVLRLCNGGETYPPIDCGYTIVITQTTPAWPAWPLVIPPPAPLPAGFTVTEWFVVDRIISPTGQTDVCIYERYRGFSRTVSVACLSGPTCAAIRTVGKTQFYGEVERKTCECPKSLSPCPTVPAQADQPFSLLAPCDTSLYFPITPASFVPTPPNTPAGSPKQFDPVNPCGRRL